jgi:predicted RNA-binding protein with PIN domain
MPSGDRPGVDIRVAAARNAYHGDVLYLVDGYNVTKADPATRDLELEEQRQELVRRLGARSTVLFGRGRVVIVFDGASVHGMPKAGGGPEVVFSRSGEQADDVIVRLAAAESGAVTLVTDDLEIEQRVRSYRGARATARLPRSSAFDAAKRRARGSGDRIPVGGLGTPPGGNAITKELKDLWLKDDEE